MLVHEELQRTQFLMSEDSLLHSAEYHSRLNVLKELNYVDNKGTRNRFTCYPYRKSDTLKYLIYFGSANERKSGL